jgi:hypothetical protein
MTQQMESLDPHVIERGQHMVGMVGQIGGGGQVVGHAVASQIKRYDLKVLTEQRQQTFPLT